LRLLRDRKGAVRVIEAFFASVLLLSCMMLIPANANTEDKSSNLASQAENVLLSLDGDGQLAAFADNRDWVGLGDCLASALPLTLWFNLTVYDKHMNTINEYPICNSGALSDEIVSVTYVCASQDNIYAIYVLQLQLAGVD
jgi:hypothetical protein